MTRMPSKKLPIRSHEFAINYPEAKVGSVWEVKTRRHFGQRRVIIGINKQGTSVHVRAYGGGPKQHAGRIYTVDAGIFIRGHILIVS